MSEINALSSMTPRPQNGPLGPGKPTDPRLWKAAQDFEMVFASQFVKAMRATSGESDLMESAPGRETFDSMFSEALARNLVENGTLGLSQSLYRDLGGSFKNPNTTPIESTNATSVAPVKFLNPTEPTHAP